MLEKRKREDVQAIEINRVLDREAIEIDSHAKKFVYNSLAILLSARLTFYD